MAKMKVLFTSARSKPPFTYEVECDEVTNNAEVVKCYRYEGKKRVLICYAHKSEWVNISVIDMNDGTVTTIKGA